MPITIQRDWETYRPFANVPARNDLQRLLEVPMFVSALRLPRGARVLEVGCGRGFALAPLARHCAPTRLAGLDVDAALIAEARAQLAADAVSAGLAVADVRRMPFPDRSFDVVVDFGTCYHVGCPEDALSEIARVLDIGGVFATETPVAQALAHPMRTLWRPLPWHAAPALRLKRDAFLWSSWERQR